MFYYRSIEKGVTSFMKDPRVGGRGHKLPYRTMTKRIPEPIAQEIDQLAQSYTDWITQSSSLRNTIVINDSEMREKMRQILKMKKGAKYSMQKLLQLLFGKEVEIKL